MKNLIILFSFGLLFVSCGAPEVSSLDELIAKQDSLKSALTMVNSQIAELDTTKEEVLLLVTSTLVEKKNFSHKIELQGQVETDQDVLINSEAAGVIKNIHVKEGQKVSKGQVLFTIDSEILQSNIEELKASLEMADYMLNKQMSLNAQGLGTEIELEQAKNQKKSLERKLSTLNSQKGKTQVRAPFSGVIDEIFPNLGEMGSPQMPLARLVNNKNVRVTASVAESHLANVKLGTAVDIIFPNYDNKTINSKISYVGNYIDPVNRTFRIQVDIKNNTMLLPNQLAKIKVTDAAIDSALVINSLAVLQDPLNNNFVYKMKAAKGEDLYSLEKIYVDVIKSYDGESVIVSQKENSISNNTRLVLSGAKGITESDIVKAQ